MLMLAVTFAVADLAIMSKLLRCHSRESGNPVRNVYPEFVEGFIKNIIEWFDRLIMSASDWIPGFAGMTSSKSGVILKNRLTKALFVDKASMRD
jgi:hypothetical protein